MKKSSLHLHLQLSGPHFAVHDTSKAVEVQKLIRHRTASANEQWDDLSRIL